MFQELKLDPETSTHLRAYAEAAKLPIETVVQLALAAFFERPRLPQAHGDDAYLILDARGTVGNCASFWGPNGEGYVCDLRRAGIYTYTQASKHRRTDVPIPLLEADRLAVLHVRADSEEFAAVRRKFERAAPPAKKRSNLGE